MADWFWGKVCLKISQRDFQCLVNPKEYGGYPCSMVPGSLGSHRSLTYSIESRYHTDVRPAVEVCGHQPELQSAGSILFSELEAQSMHWFLPPGLQLGPNVTQDLCLLGPLALEVPEDFVKDDKLHIAATPEVRAAAERAALWKEVSSDLGLSRNPNCPGTWELCQHPLQWLSLMLDLDLSPDLGPNPEEFQELSCISGACLQVCCHAHRPTQC